MYHIHRIFSAPDQATVVDPRLNMNDQNSLVTSFRSVSINDNELPLRPGWGTRGQPIKLRSNFFAVSVNDGTPF